MKKVGVNKWANRDSAYDGVPPLRFLELTKASQKNPFEIVFQMGVLKIQDRMSGHSVVLE